MGWNQEFLITSPHIEHDTLFALLSCMVKQPLLHSMSCNEKRVPYIRVDLSGFSLVECGYVSTVLTVVPVNVYAVGRVVDDGGLECFGSTDGCVEGYVVGVGGVDSSIFVVCDYISVGVDGGFVGASGCCEKEGGCCQSKEDELHLGEALHV